MSLAPPARLRRSSDVGAARRTGHKVVGQHVVIWVRPRHDGDGARMTAVATKNVGNAVQRNRAKRCLREAARLVSWDGDVDVVVQARRGAGEIGTRRLTQELAALATRA